MDSESLESKFSSIVPRVEFLDVQDQYSYNEDLICRYSLVDYDVQEGDRIAIFKLGWKFVKDYVLFEWVPKDPEENVVTFNKLCLPKSTLEIYQFCFISGENIVHGASQPFQFCDRPKNFHFLFGNSMYRKDMSMPENFRSLTNNSSLASLDLDKDKEILSMREENELLRNTLKMIVMQNKPKSCSPDLQKLFKITSELQSIISTQQSQIKELQVKVMECTDQCRKLSSDNTQLESMYKDLRGKFTQEISMSKSGLDFDIGELESIPPFPFAK